MKKIPLKVVPKIEAYAHGLQPSMSQSARLLECSYLFGKEPEPELSSEAARYGSGFHELLGNRIAIAAGLPYISLASCKDRVFSTESHS